MSRVLLGVTGGIAAYKACELCRLLVQEGHDVVPLVTPGAERFVTAETFRALARRPPAEDVYLHLTRAAILVVAPCTANTLAKLAHGLADNVLTEAALAHRGPTLVAPAMNPRMWAHPSARASRRSDRTSPCPHRRASSGSRRRPPATPSARRSRAAPMPTSSSWQPPSPITARPRRLPASGRRTVPRGRSSSSRRRTCSPPSAGRSAPARCSSASPPTTPSEVGHAPATSPSARTPACPSS